MRARRLCLGFLGALLLGSACQNDETAPDGSGGGGGSGGGAGGQSDGAASFGQSACFACIESSCQPALDGCNGEPSCAARLTCLKACPMATSGGVREDCEAACPDPIGSAAELARETLDRCRSTSACVACGGPEPDSGPHHPLLTQSCPASIESDSCAKCEDEKCCNSWVACRDDADCMSVNTCIKDCSLEEDLDVCGERCFSETPAGVGLYLARFTCISHFCFDIGLCATFEADPCERCTREHCADLYAECMTHQQCFVGLFCGSRCAADPSCIDACRSGLPDPARIALDTYLACAEASCPNECLRASSDQ